MGSRVRELFNLCQQNNVTRETGYNQKTLDSSSSYQFFRHLTDSRRRFRPSLSLDLTLVCFQLQSWGLVKYIRGNVIQLSNGRFFLKTGSTVPPKFFRKKVATYLIPTVRIAQLKIAPWFKSTHFHVRENQNDMYYNHFYRKVYLQSLPPPGTCTCDLHDYA